MRWLIRMVLSVWLCITAGWTQEAPESPAEPAAATMVVDADDQCPQADCSFRWRAALMQSGNFLALQHALNSSTYHGTLKGPFFRDWFDSVGHYRFSTWSDDDPFIVDYIGHPMMGAVVGRIQIQNDPRGMRQVVGKNKAYWKSRAKALAWSAVYTAQWELGPVSETSIGNLGNFGYYSKSAGRLTNGTGLTDLITTPVAGTAWLVGEDVVDKYVTRRIEGHSRNFFYRASVSMLTPTRSFANLLRFKAPWYRDERGAE